jgi:drug/metabolite transporter (DMT)-like permease
MILGIALALTAAICFAIGNALEKRGVDRLPTFNLSRIHSMIRGMLCSAYWMAGALISVAGLLAQVLAFSHVSIFVVQSMSTVGLLLLVAIAQIRLHEDFNHRETLGLVLAIASLLVVSLSLTNSSNAPGDREAFEPVLVLCGAAIAISIGTICSPIVRRDHHGFSYGLVTGLLYGVSGLGSKGLSTILKADGITEFASRIFGTPYPYLFVSCWILGFVVFQIGIQRCRVGIVAPLAGTVASVFVVAAGTPVFGEQFPRAPLFLTLRIAGFAGILLGSVLVSTGSLISRTQSGV